MTIIFVEDKTKSIFWRVKECKKSPLTKYYIQRYKFKTTLGIIYPGSVIAEKISKTLEVLNQISENYNFYGEYRFLTPKLQRMCFIRLTQPYSDYACPAWYLNLFEMYFICIYLSELYETVFPNLLKHTCYIVENHF